MSSNELLHVTDEFLEQNSKHAKIKKPERYITWFDTLCVSEKGREKINRIIKEDKIY